MNRVTLCEVMDNAGISQVGTPEELVRRAVPYLIDQSVLVLPGQCNDQHFVQ